jgi:hypothetical protein
VPVFVRVGVWDKAAVTNCACRVCAARVASALRFRVGDGIGVRVIVGVAVGGSVRVGEGVNVGVSGVVGVTEAVTGVA